MLGNAETVVIVPGYGLAVARAQHAVKELAEKLTHKGVTVKYAIPKEGAIIYFDMLAIPADAPRPGNAHKFINYIMRPEVHASLTNKVFYANPNKEARKFVKPEVASNPTVFLSDADMKRMAAPDAINNDVRRQMTRMYTSFKTGI